MKLNVFLAAAFLAVILLAGCRKDQKGSATVLVQTTFPEGIEVTLVNADRVGVYADRDTTDLAGRLQFVGIRPGRYKMIFQFARPDMIPSNPAYNYGESDPFEVESGTNRLEWTAGTNGVRRLD